MGQRPQLLIPNMVSTKRKVSGFTVVNRLYQIVTRASSKKVDELRDPKSRHYNRAWCETVSMLQHNAEVATVISGVRYSLGGVYSGKETPHRGLADTMKLERFADLQFHPHSKGRKCKMCGEPIGVNVNYVPLIESPHKLPSLNVSHGIPVLLGGAATDLNCMVECAYCNKSRGMFFDPAVKLWLKRVKFTVFEVK